MTEICFRSSMAGSFPAISILLLIDTGIHHFSRPHLDVGHRIKGGSLVRSAKRNENMI